MRTITFGEGKEVKGTVSVEDSEAKKTALSLAVNGSRNSAWAKFDYPDGRLYEAYNVNGRSLAIVSSLDDRK